MEIKQFEESDLKEIASWYRARNIPIPDADMIPSVGFIIPGIAAGFLIRTDVKLAIIGDFISNSQTSSEERSEALDRIASALCSEAKLLGFKYVTCSTQLGSIEQRAKKFKFRYLGTFLSYFREV